MFLKSSHPEKTQYPLKSKYLHIRAELWTGTVYLNGVFFRFNFRSSTDYLGHDIFRPTPNTKTRRSGIDSSVLYAMFISTLKSKLSYSLSKNKWLKKKNVLFHPGWNQNEGFLTTNLGEQKITFEIKRFFCLFL